VTDAGSCTPRRSSSARTSGSRRRRSVSARWARGRRSRNGSTAGITSKFVSCRAARGAERPRG
jgi:hypothetical protein